MMIMIIVLQLSTWQEIWAQQLNTAAFVKGQQYSSSNQLTQTINFPNKVSYSFEFSIDLTINLSHDFS